MKNVWGTKHDLYWTGETNGEALKIRLSGMTWIFWGMFWIINISKQNLPDRCSMPAGIIFCFYYASGAAVFRETKSNKLNYSGVHHQVTFCSSFIWILFPVFFKSVKWTFQTVVTISPITMDTTFEEDKSPRRRVKIPLSLNKRFELDEAAQSAKQQENAAYRQYKTSSSFSNKLIDLWHHLETIQFDLPPSPTSSVKTSTKCDCFRPLVSSTPMKSACSSCDDKGNRSFANTPSRISFDSCYDLMEQSDIAEDSEVDILNQTFVNNDDFEDTTMDTQSESETTEIESEIRGNIDLSRFADEDEKDRNWMRINLQIHMKNSVLCVSIKPFQLQHAFNHFFDAVLKRTEPHC